MEIRSEEHTSELQSQSNLVCRLLLEKKNRMTAVMAAVRSTGATTFEARTSTAATTVRTAGTAMVATAIAPAAAIRSLESRAEVAASDARGVPRKVFTSATVRRGRCARQK